MCLCGKSTGSFFKGPRLLFNQRPLGLWTDLGLKTERKAVFLYLVTQSGCRLSQLERFLVYRSSNHPGGLSTRFRILMSGVALLSCG